MSKKTTHAAGAAEMSENVNTQRYEALCKLRAKAVRRALPTSEALLAEAERRHAMHLLGEAKLTR